MITSLRKRNSPLLDSVNGRYGLPEEPTVCLVPVQKLIISSKVQSRVEVSRQTVEEYARDWDRGVEFPAIEVFRDAATGNFVIADGCHRFLAAKRASRKVILCRVHEGTLREAYLFSCRSNNSHGLRRSNSDKRFMVLKFLKDSEWSNWTNLRIADQCGVSHTFVSNIRKEIQSLSQNGVENRKSSFRTGSDGKKYPASRRPRQTVDRYGSKELRNGNNSSKRSVSRHKAFAAINEVRRVLMLIGLYDQHFTAIEAIERDLTMMDTK